MLSPACGSFLQGFGILAAIPNRNDNNHIVSDKVNNLKWLSLILPASLLIALKGHNH